MQLLMLSSTIIIHVLDIGQLEVLPVQIRDHFYSKVKELQVEKPPKHSFYTEIRGISSRQKYVTARVVGTDNLIVR